MPRFVPAIVALLALFLLQACAPLTIRDTATNSRVPAGSGSLELHRTVSFPRERTRVFFQDGEVVPSVNEFKPHCQLEIDALRDEVQQVQPDRFAITRVGTRVDQVVQREPIRLVGLGRGGLLHQVGGDGGAPRQMQVYLFRIQSARQPQVRALNCGGAFDDPGLAEWPTLQDIARALGDYATLTFD